MSSRGCKKYHHNTPDDVIRFLVDLGNSVNADATATTVLQVWRSTKELEPGWRRRKQLFAWTNASVGQSKLEEKKFA